MADRPIIFSALMVRPLRFEKHMNGVAWQARGTGLLYQIWRLHSGGFEVHDGSRRATRTTYEEAEALAQEWHRARVLAEIDVPREG
jgi:hypothetical protein